jgi:NADH-ubiquinone oxidoreductase chain 4
MISILIFYYSLYILILFNKSVFLYQFLESYYLNFQFFNNFEYLVGIDNISLFFLLLTSFILPICILYLRQFLNYKYFKKLIINLYLIVFFLFQVFSVLDLFLFYFFFESILIPMFFIIIIFGSRYRKIRAVYLLILYTFIGSIFMLIGLILIYFEVGSFNMILLTYFRWDNIIQYYL